VRGKILGLETEGGGKGRVLKQQGNSLFATEKAPLFLPKPEKTGKGFGENLPLGAISFVRGMSSDVSTTAGGEIGKLGPDVDRGG